MLKRIRIQNFAIIDEVVIEFGNGLNVISGETGAGKSIIMDALALILGSRASSDLIRSGAEEATVEALFEISEKPELQDSLNELGMSSSEGDLILRRILHRSGKNRIFINGNLASMANLQSVTQSLVDLCSQNDQHVLARPEEQLLWLDRFGDLDTQREKVHSLYKIWRLKQKALKDLESSAAERAQRLDFLRFQIHELSEANLSSPSEDTEIEAELKILNNSENLFAFASEALETLFGGETSNAPSLLREIHSLMARTKSMAASDPTLNQAVEYLDTLKIHGDELGHFLRSYSQNISHDEARLEELHARHALLVRIRRKYGPSLPEAIENLTRFQSELGKLENHESSLSAAQEESEQAYRELFFEAEKLRRAREKKAGEFSQAVMRELGGLHMERARFQALLQPLEEPNACGIDSLRFEIAANPGEPMGSLSKVASGGELSRVMLAMHNVVSSRRNVGVFLFDEVDAGIGGSVAIAVGAKLRRVAGHNQVICITHLPQVAAYGQSHFHVDKYVEKMGKEERTICRVTRLDQGEREHELARMLGGIHHLSAALENARALIKMANAESKPKLVSLAKPPSAKAEKKTGAAIAVNRR